MIKLLDILKEVEQDQIDLSALNNLDDEMKKALETTPKTEILGTVSIVLALPGIINAITKIIEAIAKKSGIQLKKSNPKWYQVLQKVTEKLDDYVDTPFRILLKPFIQDPSKRDKVSKIFKAAVLTLMAIFGSVDVKQIESTTSLIKNLAPDISSELIQSIAEKNASKIGSILKDVIKPLFT